MGFSMSVNALERSAGRWLQDVRICGDAAIICCLPHQITMPTNNRTRPLESRAISKEALAKVHSLAAPLASVWLWDPKDSRTGRQWLAHRLPQQAVYHATICLQSDCTVTLEEGHFAAMLVELYSAMSNNHWARHIYLPCHPYACQFTVLPCAFLFLLQALITLCNVQTRSSADLAMT